jgi:hypothetical protein
MDPNVCMQELLALLAKYKNQKDSLDEADVQDLVIHIEALDQWIKRGGFLPDRWKFNSEGTQTGRISNADNAKRGVVAGLAEYDSHEGFPEKRSIEDFYECVRQLLDAGRLV